jgi:hypothetical protein
VVEGKISAANPRSPHGCLVSPVWSLAEEAAPPDTIEGIHSISSRRPFLGFSSVFIALAVPSGSIPGGGEGGRRWSPCSGGGGKEPDRVSCQMFMVLSVKFENCFSLSCFADVLCISYPTDVSKGQEINPSII